jgi:hypothetical protein
MKPYVKVITENYSLITQRNIVCYASISSAQLQINVILEKECIKQSVSESRTLLVNRW